MAKDRDCSEYISRVLPMECEGDDWNALLQYFQLRERVFLRDRKWKLDNFNGHELDAYDKETCFYIIAQCVTTGDVFGGARLSPTLHKSFSSPIPKDPSGFMIGDAVKGLLPGLPQNLCFEDPPADPKTWELTRLVTTNRKSTESLFHEGRRFLLQNGVETLLALGSPAIFRLARSFGLLPTPLGPVVSNDSGSFLAFSTQVSGADISRHEEDLFETGIHFGQVHRAGKPVGRAIHWSHSQQVMLWEPVRDRYLFLVPDELKGPVYSGDLERRDKLVGHFTSSESSVDVYLDDGELLTLKRVEQRK